MARDGGSYKRSKKDAEPKLVERTQPRNDSGSKRPEQTDQEKQS